MSVANFRVAVRGEPPQFILSDKFKLVINPLKVLVVMPLAGIGNPTWAKYINKPNAFKKEDFPDIFTAVRKINYSSDLWEYHF